MQTPSLLSKANLIWFLGDVPNHARKPIRASPFQGHAYLFTGAEYQPDRILVYDGVVNECAPLYICKNEGSWAGSLLRPRNGFAPIKHFRTVQHEPEASPSTAQEYETLTELILETLNQAGIETLRALQPLAESDDTP